jgi:ribonuclease/clavin/mitogillin
MRDTVLGIFKHNDELFYVKRRNGLRTFPGYTSFPGGKVDKGESLKEAMVRELNEELDIIVSESHLKCIGSAVAPDFNPYRFKVHYYVIEMDERPSFVLDEGEIASGFWMKPSDFLLEYQKGLHLIIPPMEKICDYFISGDAGEVDFSLVVDEDKVPMIATLGGVHQIMPRSLTVPPATRTNSFLIGDTLIDPSPQDEAELARFENTLVDFEIKKIMLTHHHGDHHKYAPALARKWGVPIYLSADTKERIEGYDAKYFSEISLHILGEGDVLTQWNGFDVLIMEVPGHDEGQLAPYSANLAWFIAGDLFQGIGTVVVGGDEGDMVKYFSSLEKVIDLGPKCVIPSHGIALGGTNILEKTLEHRRMREDQVLDMHVKGMSLEEMLKSIYFDLPEKLIKYARANIESHLEKLRIEGKI